MKTMEVIQIEIAGKGGICHYTYNLSKALARTVKIELVTNRNYELKSFDRQFRLRELFNRFKTNPVKIVKYIWEIRTGSSKILHFQLSQRPFFILLLLCLIKLISKNKIVVTSHNVFSHEKKAWESKIYRAIYKMADRIIVHSRHSKKIMQEYFNLKPEKIEVMPHGNYMFFNEKLEINKNELIAQGNILFFGYIREYKGLLYLIRALAKVKQKLPQAKLFIVGKPVESFAKYQEKIDSLGLNDSVEKKLEYIPFAQVKEYFNRANVVVLPYLDISQSGILQLAFGFGKPVVVTNVGGLPEAVEEGRNGFVVEPKDSDELAEKIIMILKDKNLQKKMGEYALNLARTIYSWDEIARKTINIYESLL